MPRRFFIREHLQKAKAYKSALEWRGYKQVSRVQRANIVFFDHDIDWSRKGNRSVCYTCHRLGVPFFIYPHTGRVPVLWDLNFAWEHTACNFVQAKGDVEVLRRLEYPCPVEAVGWSYSEIKPFQPSTINGKPKVLFAPIHPLGNGYLHPPDMDINFKTFKLLLKYIDYIDLTVRHVGELGQNKIWKRSGVKYVKGYPDNSIQEIEEADVVISAFTHAYISIALGKPTIMIGESIRPHAGSNLRDIYWGMNWDRYRDYIHYPFNAEDCFDNPMTLMDMIGQVIRYNRSVTIWKDKFIGEPFRPNYFIDVMESYL